MPNYEVDTAKEEIEILKKEIAEERQYYEDVMKNIQDGKAKYEEEQRSHYMALKLRYQEVLENLHQKEAYNNDIVKDHLELKHLFELEERAQQEENEQLNQENQILRNSIRALCNETKKTVDNARNEYELNSEEFSKNFREQNMQHAKNMQVIKDQYKKMSNLYKEKKEALEKQNEYVTGRLDMSEKKRKLDLEGFGADLSNLKKRMIFYQNYIGKLKNLVDKEEDNIISEKQRQLFNQMENDVIMEDEKEEE